MSEKELMQIIDERKRAYLMLKINKYIVEEAFPMEHIEAISTIVYNFNESEDIERLIFNFVKALRVDIESSREIMGVVNEAHKF